MAVNATGKAETKWQSTHRKIGKRRKRAGRLNAIHVREGQWDPARKAEPKSDAGGGVCPNAIIGGGKTRSENGQSIDKVGGATQLRARGKNYVWEGGAKRKKGARHIRLGLRAGKLLRKRM
jgi:hypothetical protein